MPRRDAEKTTSEDAEEVEVEEAVEVEDAAEVEEVELALPADEVIEDDEGDGPPPGAVPDPTGRFGPVPRA